MEKEVRSKVQTSVRGEREGEKEQKEGASAEREREMWQEVPDLDRAIRCNAYCKINMLMLIL